MVLDRRWDRRVHSGWILAGVRRCKTAGDNLRRACRDSRGTRVPGPHTWAQTICFGFNSLAVGNLVAMSRGMPRWFLLLAVVLLLPTAAQAQEIEPADGTTIGSAQVSGIDIDRLSP